MIVDLNTIDKQIKLPSPPAIVQRLQDRLSEKNVSYTEIAHIIETDQAFTARILRLVNSPFYGFAGKITSIEEAITMLGLNTIHQLLLTTSIINTIRVQNAVIDINRFWIHSFGAGVIAKHLLVNQNKDKQSEGFLGGILHDIGRLIFIQLDTSGFEKLYSNKETPVTLEMEKQYFGVDHQKIGEVLAKKWNFPASIVKAIAHHHSPESVKREIEVASAVHISDLLCHAMSVGDSGSYYITRFCQSAWEALDISYNELEIVLRKAVTEIDQSRDLLMEIGK